MKRIMILVLAMLLLCGCQPKIQTQQEEPGYNGLILEAPSYATVTLYPESVDNAPVIPAKTERQDSTIRYYYPEAMGSYYYSVSASGYYNYTKALYIAPQQKGVEMLVQIEPEQMAGDGWEPEKYYAYTSQMMSYKPDDPALWPDYPEAFSTPAFEGDHAAHQSTTQQQLEDYIKAIDEEDDQMYVFSAGGSAYGLNVPLVIFTTTDLSGASTLEEAAALLCENGKLTIHYQGHIHGNEPAGGEAALAMVKRLDGEQGKALIEKVNVYVIPRVNPDGAKNYTRKATVGDIDLNRDLFDLQAAETRNLLRVVQLLEPTIMIDSHEYTASIFAESEVYADMQVSPGFVADPNEELAALSIDLVQNVFDKLEEQNLSYKYYLNSLNSQNVTTVRDYFCRLGKLTFVLESKGINYGNTTLGRRTVGHMVSAWEIMTRVAEDPGLYLDAAARWKKNTLEAGLTYAEEDVVILQRQETVHPEYDLVMESFNLMTGDRSVKTVPSKINDAILRSRTAPTAYVIPADTEWTESVLAYMDLHGISYTKLPAGSRLYLQQYTGTTEKAELTAEKSVSFPKGAYVFTMAQEQAMILSLLMEPDAADMEGSTLAQRGLIPCEDGEFLLYRYIRDLKEDGSI